MTLKPHRERLSVTATVFLILLGIVAAIGLYYAYIFWSGTFPS
jgi:hypothetical protein